jgi:hypothetical protein
MVVLGKRSVKNGQALIGHAQAFVGEKGLEFFAGRFGAHSENFPSRARGVNAKRRNSRIAS